jgi:hypothetical protein
MPDIKTVVYRDASFQTLLDSVEPHQARRLSTLNQRSLVKSVIITTRRDVVVNTPTGTTITVRRATHLAPVARRAFIAALGVAVCVSAITLHANEFGIAALCGLAVGMGSAWPRHDGGHSNLTRALFGASAIFGLREALDVERQGGSPSRTRTAR